MATKKTTFSVRVTKVVDDEFKSKLSSLLMKYASHEALAVVEKRGTDNEHVHLWFRTSQAWFASHVRTDVSKMFGVSGAGKLAVKDPNAGKGTDIKCLQYLCKGESVTSDVDVVARIGITEDDVQRYHQVYWSVNAESSGERRSKQTIYEQLSHLCEGCTGPYDVIDRCVEWYSTVKRHVPYYMFKDIVFKLTVETNEDMKVTLRDRLVHDIFG